MDFRGVLFEAVVSENSAEVVRDDWRLGANLKRGNPRNLRVAAAYEYESEEDAYAGEQAAHKEFAEFAHQKEWFRVRWQVVARWFEKSGANVRV